MISRWLHRITRIVLFLFTVSLVGAAFLLLAIRALWPMVPQYHSYIEQWVQDHTVVPVSFELGTAEWTQFGPAIALSNVTLEENERNPATVNIGKAFFVLDVFESVQQFKPVAYSLYVKEVSVEGEINFAKAEAPSDKLETKPQETSMGAKQVISAIASGLTMKGGLFIEDINADIILPHGKAAKVDEGNLAVIQQQGLTHIDFSSGLIVDDKRGKISLVSALKGGLDNVMVDQVPVYIRSADMPLSWVNEFTEKVYTDGTLSFESWWTFQSGKLERVVTRFEAYDLLITQKNMDKPFSLDYVTGLSMFDKAADQWSVQFKDVTVTNNNLTWPNSDGYFISGNHNNKKVWVASGNFLDLSVLAPVTRLLKERINNDDLANSVATLSGQIKDWQIIFPGNVSLMQFNAQATDIGWQAGKRMPGFAGLDGELSYAARNWLFDLNSGGVTLSQPSLFRQPLEIDSLTGRLSFQKQPFGWEITSKRIAVRNDNIEAIARVRTILRKRKPTFLDLKVAFDGTGGNNAYRYFPAGIMGDNVLNWLDGAFLKGETTNGSVIFHGLANDFPFEDGSGVFEVTSDFQALDLNYHDDWPNITDAAGSMRFKGRSMLIEAHDGKIYDANVKKVIAEIDDFKKTLLTIDGVVEGATKELINFVNASPLHKKYGEQFSELNGTGNATLELDIDMPLKKLDAVAVQGDIEFAGGGINLKSYPLEVTDLTGNLRFNAQGLFSNNLKGQYFGYPIDIELDSLQEGENPGVNLMVIGELGVDVVSTQLNLPPIPYIEGKSDWMVHVHFPREKWKAISMTVASDLVGTAINLPNPLGKPAEIAEETTLKAELGKNADPIWRAASSHGKSVILKIGDDKKIAAAGIAIGDIDNRLPEKGVELRGDISYLRVKDWLALLPEKPRGPKHGAETTSETPLLSDWALDLNIQRLELVSSNIANANIKSRNADGAWQVFVTSDAATGEIYWPNRLSEYNPVIANFSKLHWRTSESDSDEPAVEKRKETKTILPNDYPHLSMRCSDCKFNDYNLGNVRFKLNPTPSVLAVNELAIENGSTKLNGSVVWSKLGAEDRTVMDINLASKNVGKALVNFGFTGTLKKGKGSGEARLHWPVSMHELSAETLNGDIALKIEDAELLDVSPGAGRMFGFLSVQALPRRLSLDFSDVFNSGFVFDEMKSKFTITDGVANIESFSLLSTSAEIFATGQLDLVNKTYQQTLTVIPDLSAGVTLAGTLAGGPGVGAVLYLAQKIVKPKLAEFRYSVTGPWKKPKVERLFSPQTEQEFKVDE